MSDETAETPQAPRVVGRYALFDEIAAGGMATVHLGRLVGQVGFSRTVAVKRLHPQYAKDEDFVSMFVDEARLASRIQHPNVVSTLDVVKTQDELFLVMDYVQGEALSKLVRNAAKRGERIPPRVVLSVMSGMLHGLHAAHEAKSETREPLNIVHRDISPQNVLVGMDGVARVLDFGVAKAAMRSGATKDGQMKGKLSYMSPEQLNGKEVDRRGDVFAAGIVLWEALVGRRLFAGSDAGEILGKVLTAEITPPEQLVPNLPAGVSDAVMKALEREAEDRFQTARDFAIALEHTGETAAAHNVGEWVREYGGEELGKRANLVTRIESHPMDRLEMVVAAANEDSEVSVGEHTSGVAPPVNAEAPEPPRARGVVTVSLLILGSLVGVMVGRELFIGPVTSPVQWDGRPQSPSAALGVVSTPRPRLQPSPPSPSSTGAKPEPHDAGVTPKPPRLSVRPQPRRKSPPPRTQRPRKRRLNCDPPFTRGPDGIKKIKPGCL